MPKSILCFLDSFPIFVREVYVPDNTLINNKFAFCFSFKQ